jgi:hypothetical protein
LRQSTIGKIKEMVNNLDLEVSCKIWKLIFDECELLLYLCNSRFRVRWNWEPFCIGTACFVYDFHAETPSGFFWQFLRENKTIYHIWNWVWQSFSLIFISNFLIKSINFSSSEGLWWIQNIFREKITQTRVCSINFMCCA